jgi:xylitol oxidase
MATPNLASPRTNWSGNLTYSASQLFTPTSLDELRTLLLTYPHLKPLGSRHCFNTIADTSGPHISLTAFNDIHIDPASRTVTLGAGLTYGQLTPVLAAHGFALANLASLPHISVAGAILTATHGSGSSNGNLATAVSAIELLTPAGDLLHISRATHPDTFPAYIVSLGALGILTSLTLDLQPAFTIAQSVYQNLPFATLEHNLEAIFASAYSVSLFTDWQSGVAHQAWVKRRMNTEDSATNTPPPNTFFGATLQTASLHPLPGQPATSCTTQFGIPGPSHERLPHFRLDFTPSMGAELQSEYFVPLRHAYPALRAIESLRAHLAPHLFVIELRTIAPDDLWLSTTSARPSQTEPSLAIHFTWRPHQPQVLDLLPRIESALAPFAARPHWGKLFTTSAETIATLYPRLPDFRRLQSLHDPAGQLRNPYLTAIGL